MAVEEAESLGCKNVADMIAGFRRAEMLENIGTFKEPDGMVRVRETRLGDGTRSFPAGRPPPGIRGSKARKPRGRTV